MRKLLPGEEAFIVETNHTLRKVTVIRHQGDRYYIRFENRRGGICVKEDRLFLTAADALMDRSKRTYGGNEPISREEADRRRRNHLRAIMT